MGGAKEAEESYANGAFVVTKPGDIRITGASWSSSKNGPAYSFEAVRSSSAYKDNGKVYPASIALNFIIKC